MTIHEEVVRVKRAGQGPLPYIRDYYFHPDAGWAILSYEPIRTNFGLHTMKPADERQVITLLDKEGNWRADWNIEPSVWNIVYYGPTGVVVSDLSSNYKIVLKRVVDGKIVTNFDGVWEAGRDTNLFLNASGVSIRTYCNMVILISLADSAWVLDTQLHLIDKTESQALRDIKAAACGTSGISFVYPDMNGAHYLHYSFLDNTLKQREIYGLLPRTKDWSDSRIGPWPTETGASILVPSGYPVKYWKLRTVNLSNNPTVEMTLLNPGDPLPDSAFADAVDGELDFSNVSKATFDGKLPGYYIEALEKDERERLKGLSESLRYERGFFPGYAMPRVFWPVRKACRGPSLYMGILCEDLQSNQLSPPLVPESALWQALGSRWFKLTQISDDWVHLRSERLFSISAFKFIGRGMDAGSYSPSFEGLECDIWQIAAVGEKNDAYVPCRRSVFHQPEHPPPWEVYVSLTIGEIVPASWPLDSSLALPGIRRGKLMKISSFLDSVETEKLRLMDIKSKEEVVVALPKEWEGQKAVFRRIQPTENGWLIIYGLSETGLWVWAMDEAGKPLGPPRLLPDSPVAAAATMTLYSGRLKDDYLVAMVGTDCRFYLVHGNASIVGTAVLDAESALSSDVKGSAFPGVAINSEDGVYLFYPDRIVRLRLE